MVSHMKAQVVGHGILESARTRQWPIGFKSLAQKGFFKKILEDISPFCEDTDTPVLDFW